MNCLRKVGGKGNNLWCQLGPMADNLEEGQGKACQKM